MYSSTRWNASFRPPLYTTSRLRPYTSRKRSPCCGFFSLFSSIFSPLPELSPQWHPFSPSRLPRCAECIKGQINTDSSDIVLFQFILFDPLTFLVGAVKPTNPGLLHCLFRQTVTGTVVELHHKLRRIPSVPFDPVIYIIIFMDRVLLPGCGDLSS